MTPTPSYRGRFAPTPSGALHFGSLVTALASWLDARAQGGEWLVRIDDLDPPREAPGSADQILRQLDACGLQWDGPVRYQSQRHESYRAAIEQLLDNNQAFYCPLSRSALNALDGKHPGPSVAASTANNNAIRLAVGNLGETSETCFEDRFVGRHCDNLNEREGAFVIVRRDGLYAYQLACALDDANDGITDIVRGSDLLTSTSRQICVLNALSQTLPRYGHLPLVTDSDGCKLAKSNSSAAIDVQHSQPALRQALIWLGGPAIDGAVNDILDGGIDWWREGAIGLRHQDAGPAPEQSLP